MTTFKELDRALNEMFNLDYAYSSNYSKAYYSSKSDENQITYEIYACGATKDDVKVDIQESVLTVSIEPKSASVFSRPVKLSYMLPKDIDVDSVDAKLENGILNLCLKRVKAAKKTVSISVN